MKRVTKIIIASALTIGVVGGVAAHGKYKGAKDPARMAAHIVNKVSDKLDLDAAQRTALEGLSAELQDARKTMKSSAGADKEALIAMITADTFDQARALDMVNAKTNAIQASAPQIISSLGNFLDTLSAEQKAEIAEHMQKHRGRHGRKHRERGEGDDG